MGSEVHLKWSRFGFRSLTFRWVEPQHAASTDKYFMMLLCSSRLFWGGVVRELFFFVCVDRACSTCFLRHLKGQECKSKPQISPVARVANRPLLLLGNKMDFFPRLDVFGRCQRTSFRYLKTLPALVDSCVAFCARFSLMFPRFRETFFPLPQFLPNDQRSHLNSVPFLTRCLTSRAEDPCVLHLPSFLLAALPLHRSLSSFFLTVPDYISRHVGVIVLSKPLKFILHKGECNLIGGGDVCQSGW